MINHLATAIQTVTNEYKAKLERQEEKYNQVYHQLKEAAAQVEATASTSQQYSGHLDKLWNQCQQLKVEITTLTEKVHREIVALKLAQEGNQRGIKRFTDDIYNDVASDWTGYMAKLRERIRTECGGLSNAIVAFSSDFRSDIASVNKDLEDEEKYSYDLNELVEYWKGQVDGLGLQVKSLEAKALAQAVLIKDLGENPKAGAPTSAQVDPVLVGQMKSLTDRVDRYAVRYQRQQDKLDILESCMCKCGKEQARYRSPNPNLYFHNNSNLKNGNEESDCGEEEAEEVPVQPNTERTPKASAHSTPVATDRKVSDVEMFDGISTALQGFLDHLDTFFEMKPASFPVGEHKKKIMYISL